MHLVMLQWLRCYIVVVLKIIVIQSDHQIISSTWQSSFTQSPLGRVNSSRVSKLQLPKSPRVWLMNSQGRKTLSDGQQMSSILLTINFTISIDFFTITIVLITTTIVNITITTINIISSIMISPQVAIDEKSHQWFGATVASSGEDGVVVVSCDIALVTL